MQTMTKITCKVNSLGGEIREEHAGSDPQERNREDFRDPQQDDLHVCEKSWRVRPVGLHILHSIPFID